MSEAAVIRLSLGEACQPQHSFRPRVVGAVQTAVTNPATDPFADGFAEGQRATEAHYVAERARLQRLVAAAAALQPESSEELALMIATTVERLVRELVGTVPIDAGWLSARIDRALGCIEQADAARTLWLHPDDLGLIDPALIAVDIQPDATIERGALRIDCARGWIEDARSIHLEALRVALGLEANA